MLRGSLDVQNPGTSSHPLGGTILNHTTTANGVGVFKDAINDVGDRFKATMWVPRRSLGFAGSVFDFAHLVHVDEGVECRC